MKKKILGIVICTLLIGLNGLAFADWDVGDGHIMHSPQLPDPYGLDVDFHDWWLGDDWYTVITHDVTDIHFWYSWRDDVVQDIPWIQVSIWSDFMGPPSKPLEQLWYREFTEDEFVIRGPFGGGSQGWFQPPDLYIPNEHEHYYQINIMNIPDPFEEQAGETYWLVIHLPFYSNPGIGWKTTLDNFRDNAVYGTPTTGWEPLWDPRNPGQPIDFAFVITGNEPARPEINCEGALGWELVRPGIIVYDHFIIKNIGDSGSNLDWKITSWPTWGTWAFNPSNGTDLPAGNSVTVNVTVKAPNQPKQSFTGLVEVCNEDNTTDCCTVTATLTTPRIRNIINKPFLQFLKTLFQDYPNLIKMLRQLQIS